MAWIEQRRRADGDLTARVFWRPGGCRDTPREWETFGAGLGRAESRARGRFQADGRGRWSAVARLVDDKAGLIARAAALAQRHDVYLHVGLGVLSRRAPHMRNQAILVDPAGQVVWTYDKARPVPGMDQLSPGDGGVPTVDTPYGKLANLICFDADFRARAPERGQGRRHDAGSIQRLAGVGAVHTQKATLRAIENGYSLVCQDTEGLAQVVDFQGHVLAASDYFTTDQQTMVAYVPTQGDRTIYAMVGDVFAWLSIAALAVLIGATRLVRRSARRIPPDSSSIVAALTSTGAPK